MENKLMCIILVVKHNFSNLEKRGSLIRILTSDHKSWSKFASTEYAIFKVKSEVWTFQNNVTYLQGRWSYKFFEAQMAQSRRDAAFLTTTAPTKVFQVVYKGKTKQKNN